MAYCTYQDRSGFHWNSDLSDVRKQQIVEWVRDLGHDEQIMLNEILADARDQAYEEATADECF